LVKRRFEEMQQVVRKENLVEVAEALARHEVRYLFAGGMVTCPEKLDSVE
jgi:hypothetical protein